MTDLFIGNTIEVRLSDLQDQDGDAITGATVEVTIKNQDGTEVSGETWPVTLSDLGNGNYSGSLSSNIDLTVGTVYEIVLVATKSSLQAKWRKLRPAKYRTF